MGGNSAEGDQGSSGGCSSRPPASPLSNEGLWRERESRKGSAPAAAEPKLTLGRQLRVIGDDGDGGGRADERKNERNEVSRSTEAGVEAAAGSTRFRRKMDGCLAQVVEAAAACGPASSMTTTTVNTAIFPSASGSSTPAGDTRLAASLLFELPESCGSSAANSASKMPAITKAQMKGLSHGIRISVTAQCTLCAHYRENNSQTIHVFSCCWLCRVRRSVQPLRQGPRREYNEGGARQGDARLGTIRQDRGASDDAGRDRH